MCLFSQNIKPLISDKDITVFKLLVGGISNPRTPFRNTSVNLNSVLKAEGSFPTIPSDYSYNQIGEGCIHAHIDILHDSVSDYYTVVKAIVKAGTPFYVSVDVREIAAREMYITSEKVNNLDEVEAIQNETRNIIYNMLCDKIRIGDTLVRVGDVLLSDKKTYVSPENFTKDMNVIGVIGFITDTPHIIALESKLTPWAFKYGDLDINDYDNGRKNTDLIIQKYDIPLTNYFWRKKGWYVPSANEMIQIARNGYIIDVTIAKLQSLGIKAHKILSSAPYWTSTCCGLNVFEVDTRFAKAVLNDCLERNQLLRLMLR